MARKQSLVERFGKLPAGLSQADVDAVLQFLYGAFDKRAAKQVRIAHPYQETGDGDAAPTELTVFEFCSWLRAAAG